MRLVIHAGFAKCGSSSIQTALQDAQSELRGQSIYVFGKDLRINTRSSASSAPIWSVAETFIDAPEGKVMTARMARELERLAKTAPQGTAVLSAELLAKPGSAGRFSQIDEQVDTTVVFYIRPQFEWIGSAWKQWSLREGISLKDYVDRCLSSNRPPFQKTIEDWATTLPKAKIIVRMLAETAANGGPAKDFFDILGAPRVNPSARSEHVNPNLDFAILHLLSKNPDVFRGRSDNAVFKSLLSVLPPKYAKTNIELLSAADKQRIAEHFAEENLHILRRYCGLDGRSAEDVYNSSFRPSGSGRSYEEVEELELAYRGMGILLETLLDLDRKRIFRRPYRNVPQRLAKRLSSVRNRR